MIGLIYAIDLDGVLGIDGAIPWALPQDMAHFRKTTIGKTIVMGRGTWHSLPDVLPKRKHVVVTTDKAFADTLPKGVEALIPEDVEDLIQSVRSLAYEDGEVWVIGGASLIEIFLPIADRVEFTRIHVSAEKEAFEKANPEEGDFGPLVVTKAIAPSPERYTAHARNVWLHEDKKTGEQVKGVQFSLRAPHIRVPRPNED